jgi:hypothetical protein
MASAVRVGAVGLRRRFGGATVAVAAAATAHALGIRHPQVKLFWCCFCLGHLAGLVGFVGTSEL